MPSRSPAATKLQSLFGLQRGSPVSNARTKISSFRDIQVLALSESCTRLRPIFSAKAPCVAHAQATTGRA